MVAVHDALGTWVEKVDVYVALTEFARRKFVQGGLPAERVVVKPHFVHPDPGPGAGDGGFALFVGRLSPEKGVDTLLAAWSRLGRHVPLKVVGDGPGAREVAGAAERRPEVTWLGHQPAAAVSELMGQASVLVFPSRWHETFGLVVIEAFAKGTPVIAARVGAMPEMVDHGRTGLLFRAGDADDLAAQVEWAFGHPAELSRMREEARREFEAEYGAERNYEMLMEVYSKAAGRA
jgi:glycosyltransferase involved in cell wall biosynthesis